MDPTNPFVCFLVPLPHMFPCAIFGSRWFHSLMHLLQLPLQLLYDVGRIVVSLSVSTIPAVSTSAPRVVSLLQARVYRALFHHVFLIHHVALLVCASVSRCVVVFLRAWCRLRCCRSAILFAPLLRCRSAIVGSARIGGVISGTTTMACCILFGVVFLCMRCVTCCCLLLLGVLVRSPCLLRSPRALYSSAVRLAGAVARECPFSSRFCTKFPRYSFPSLRLSCAVHVVCLFRIQRSCACVLWCGVLCLPNVRVVRVFHCIFGSVDGVLMP